MLIQPNAETIKSLNEITTLSRHLFFVLGYWFMKKVLETMVLGLLLSGNAYAKEIILTYL
jgi:hypothetical protein